MKNKFSQLYKFNINLPEVRGVIKKNFQLSRLSWLRVGGPASVFFQPEDEDDLSFFLRNLDSSINLFSALDFVFIGVKKKWNKLPNGWEDELIFQLLCE